MKTFIRRLGNKSKHLKTIIPLIPEKFNTYIEPFLGSGAVFLHLLPKKWIINDINKDIMSIWELSKDEPEYLISQINLFKKTFLPLSNEDKLKHCKKITSNLEKMSGKKKTVTVLILIYCSFQGCIERDNKYSFDGLYSHIYKSQSVHIFTEAYRLKIKELSTFLKHGLIFNTDYKKILKKSKKGDFIFLDPPYIEEKKYTFQYNKNEVFDINELLKELKKLDNNGVKWMMTQIDNDLVRKTFKNYRTVEYINKNDINGANSVGKKEVIIMNY